jgi:hypothetical protein
MNRETAKQIVLPVVLEWQHKTQRQASQELTAEVHEMVHRLQALNAQVDAFREADRKANKSVVYVVSIVAASSTALWMFFKYVVGL